MRIHFISIGGAAMHNLALALKSKGHELTGSDDAIYEPSRSRLAAAGLLPEKEGWFADKINLNLDMVLLGMHARIDNPELIRAQQLGLKIYSYPEFLFKESKNKKRIVVGGSHGKTTITSMVLHALKFNGLPADYMVGAAIEGFDTMVKLSQDSPSIIIEGDEYLSSPIDLRPKFLHYKPNVALISGIAWDHMNVFKTYESYTEAFEKYIESIEEGGTLVYNSQDMEVVRIVEKTFKQKPELRVKKVPYATHPYKIEGGKCVLLTTYGDFTVPVFGRHNMSNIEAAKLLAKEAGLDEKDFYTAMQSFKGAAKRLELWAQSKDTIVYKDFAHAPSKVRATVAAVKEMYPEREVVAVLELHTYSSLSREFLPQYENALAGADSAYVFYSKEAMELKRMPELDPKWVHDLFRHPKLKVYRKLEVLKEDIFGHNHKGKVYLFMSSGVWEGTDWAKELIK